MKPLEDGAVAVGLFNRHKEVTRAVNVPWEGLAIHDRRPCRLTDLWTGDDLGVHTRVFGTQLPPHSCRIIKLTPLPYQH
jgi:hypothetical protein